MKFGRRWPFLLLPAVVLIPLFVVDMPPLLDYPNHLARAFILSRDDPVLSQFYQPRWALIPNLGTDLVLPELLRWLPVSVAGRLMLGFILLLPVIGAIAYSRAVFGRASYWSLGAFLLAYNGTFLLGFLNFELALGLALLFGAVWARYRESLPKTTILLCALGSVALFFCHLMGVLTLLILVAAREIVQPGLWRRALLAAPLAILPAALFLLSALQHVQTEILWQPWQWKLLHAAMSLLNYDVRLDITSALAIIGVAVAILLTRRFDGSFWAVGLAAGLYLLTPFTYKGTLFLDVRFAVLSGFLLFATLQPRLPPRAARTLAACAVALLLIRTAVVAQVWYQHRADLAELRAAIAPVEPGSRVLLATVSEAEAPAAWAGELRRQTLSDGTRLDMHTAALLVIERRAFWPFLFADPSQQPIALRSPYSEIAVQTLNVPNLKQLTARSMRPGDQDIFPIEGQWRCCYEYVLVLEAGAAATLKERDLEPLVTTPYAALFRVAM